MSDHPEFVPWDDYWKQSDLVWFAMQEDWQHDDFSRALVLLIARYHEQQLPGLSYVEASEKRLFRDLRTLYTHEREVFAGCLYFNEGLLHSTIDLLSRYEPSVDITQGYHKGPKGDHRFTLRYDYFIPKAWAYLNRKLAEGETWLLNPDEDVEYV